MFTKNDGWQKLLQIGDKVIVAQGFGRFSYDTVKNITPKQILLTSGSKINPETGWTKGDLACEFYPCTTENICALNLFRARQYLTNMDWADVGDADVWKIYQHVKSKIA